MIKIARPNIKFKITPIYDDDEFYMINSNSYVIKNIRKNEIHFFDEKGNRHREDGYASKYSKSIFFVINEIDYDKFEFAEKTNHLICKNCQSFCNQNCFK